MSNTAMICISIFVLSVFINICLFIAVYEGTALLLLGANAIYALLVLVAYCGVSTARINVIDTKPETITRTKSLIIVTKGSLVVSSNDISMYGSPDSLIVIRKSDTLNQYGFINNSETTIAVK